ncbi:MAG: 7-cyano-7-deazaguanine synthase [Candidatus Bathyarchaeia archaeon]
MGGSVGKSVVVMSGGIDSSGAAAYWKQQGYSLYLATFYYGQRSRMEVERARDIGRHLQVMEHRFIDISFMKELYGSTNVLTDEGKEMPSRFQLDIIVPIRNAIFLTIAAAWAFSIGAEIVAYGAHLTDQPYPDCRPVFAEKLTEVLNLGDADNIDSKIHPPITIWSPAIAGLQKWEMLKISYRILGERIFDTWSCYLDGPLHCGVCESCRNRKAAFERAGIKDKTVYSK